MTGASIRLGLVLGFLLCSLVIGCAAPDAPADRMSTPHTGTTIDEAVTP